MAENGSGKFLQAFLRNPGQVGAIAPSSRFLAEAMLEGLRVPEPGEVLVEFGPGTGAITSAIERFLPDPGAYLGIERDPTLVAHLQKRFPNLRFVNESAEHTSRILEAEGHSRVHSVLSGLPFASLPDEVCAQILQDLHRLLHENGTFRTFQYVHAYLLPKAKRFRRDMASYFGKAQKMGPIYRNFPPAWILSWGA
ncbi:MAG TPA: methyltransferase domain-containing protein [Planctomycetes bacterium]|nr:methyltransferase domain-containing protein [Planctomycetota bacterium]